MPCLQRLPRIAVMGKDPTVVLQLHGDSEPVQGPPHEVPAGGAWATRTASALLSRQNPAPRGGLPTLDELHVSTPP